MKGRPRRGCPKKLWLAACAINVIILTGSAAPAWAEPEAMQTAPVAPGDVPEAAQIDGQLSDLYAAERYSEAEPLARRALEIRERTLGRDHPATLATVHNLAMVLLAQDRHSDAEPLLQRAFADRERVLGRDDPETLLSLKRLGDLYRSQGRLAEAEPLYRRAVEDSERVLGRDHADTLLSINQLGELHEAQGRHAEAELLFRRALESSERALGRDAPTTLRAVINLALSYRAQRRLVEAEPFYRRALEDSERIFGRDSPDTLPAVRNLGQLYREQRRFGQAETLYARALQDTERVLGRDHPNTLAAVNELALLYLEQDRHAEAEPLLRRAIEDSQRVLGRNDPTTLTAVNSLADFLTVQRRYQEAEPFHRRVLEDRERVLGREHPDTLGVLSELGLLYLELGRPAEAEPLLRRALQGRERTLGREHSDTLLAVTDLGRLAYALGRYAEAEQLYRRAADDGERVFGLSHPSALAPIANLAGLYRDQGRYAEAEPLARRALEETERVLGPDHPNTLASINNMAVLYQAQGRFADAEPLFLRSVQSVERVRGREHLDTLRAVVNLAGLYLDQGRYADAEPLLRRGLDNSERVFGRDHPEAIRAASHLGSVYLAEGRYAEAEPLFSRSLEAAERTLGREHPTTLADVHNLGLLYFLQQRYAEAEPLLRRVLEDGEETFGRTHPNLLATTEALVVLDLAQGSPAAETLASARQLLTSVRQRQLNGRAGLQARAQRGREALTASERFSVFAEVAWIAALADETQQARLLAEALPEAFMALQDAVSGATDRAVAEQAARRYVSGRNPELGELMRERQRLENEWTRLDQDLAVIFGAGPDSPERPAAIRERLEAVQGRIEAIDARLRVEASDYFALIEPSPLDVGAAQQLLGPDEAILLTVPSRYSTHIFALTRDEIVWRRSDWTAQRVRDAVQRLRWDAGALVQATEEELARLRADQPSEGRARFDRATAHALYQQLVAPIAASLAGKRRLYIAAGGALAGLPFSILVAAPPGGADDDPAALRETRWFGDDFALVHISSIQSLALLRHASSTPGTAGRFRGIGDPVLGGSDTSRERGATRAVRVRSASQLFPPGRTRDGGLIADVSELRRLPRLPGTALELESVRRALNAPEESLLLAVRATESNVRAADLSQDRIILFATHGLTASEASGVGEAGLVLTPPAEARDGDDGFLAASEVTMLRLNADWVILSACNTATGDGTDNAGLGQLARAFFYAGARNLLASHWPVSDDVAPVLIARTLALERTGKSRAEAFQQAMREIRMDASHDTATDSWSHPFYWAPFVLVGGGR